MNTWEAAKAWRAKYLEQVRVHLALVEYLDQPGATLEGVAQILSGSSDPSREA